MLICTFDAINLPQQNTGCVKRGEGIVVSGACLDLRNSCAKISLALLTRAQEPG